MSRDQISVLVFGFVCLLLGAWCVWAVIGFRARWRLRRVRPTYDPESLYSREELTWANFLVWGGIALVILAFFLWTAWGNIWRY